MSYKAYKFNLTTGAELNKSFNLSDFEAPSASFTITKNDEIRINQDGRILLSVIFEDQPTALAHTSMLAISGDSLEIDQGVGVNGSIVLKTQQADISATHVAVEQLMVSFIDDKFIYMFDGSTSYDIVGDQPENIQAKYLHKRYRLNGEEDLIYTKITNDIVSEYDEKNAPSGVIEDYVIYSLPVFLGENFIKVVTYGGYNDLAKEMANGLTSQSTLDLINLKFSKINTKGGEALDHKSFDMSYLEYSTNSSDNEDAYIFN